MLPSFTVMNNNNVFIQHTNHLTVLARNFMRLLGLQISRSKVYTFVTS